MSVAHPHSDDAKERGAAIAEASPWGGARPEIGPDVPPQQLIFTVLGQFTRGQDGWLSSAAIVRLSGSLGITDPIARSAISRMKRQGYVESSRQEGRAGYRLTQRSIRIILDAEKRIFGRARAEADDRWIIVGYSVPESRRELRHQIRTALIRLGFGTISPGVWIAPDHLGDEARGALRQLGVADFVDVFSADYLAFGEPAAKVAAWWDLELFTTMYYGFIERFGPFVERESGTLTPEEAFRVHVSMRTAWQRLPYLDPGLPLALLPSPWPGTHAEEVFTRLDAALSGPAAEYFTAHR